MFKMPSFVHDSSAVQPADSRPLGSATLLLDRFENRIEFGDSLEATIELDFDAGNEALQLD